MRLLVTGGAGFIGSHLVERLVDGGHHVDVIDDLSSGSLGNLADARASRTGRLTIHQVDVRDPGVPDLMVRREPEVVFHLAARADAGSFDESVADAEVNVGGSVNVLEGARRAGTRKVVFASSGAAIYAPATGAQLPLREKHPQQPLTPHGVAKKAVVDYLVAYRECHDLEFTTLVLAEVYGPRQRHGLVAEVLAAVAAAEPVELAADGARTCDLVYVDDVVDAFIRAADKGSGLVANIGTGLETSIDELVEAAGEALGSEPVPVVAAGGPDGHLRFALDPGRARIHLGWSSWTSLSDGLVQAIDRG
ncbi:MAG: NAD-dependent epimerase/dehydratase family protein [Acidimicrobiales bacterium]